jgi:serine/threonine protein kinase
MYTDIQVVSKADNSQEYILAIKTFTGEARSKSGEAHTAEMDFLQEKKVLSRLRDQTAVINFLGYYSIDNGEAEIETHKTSLKDNRKDQVRYNVIMHFADRDLDECLKSPDGPWKSGKFIEFWSKFFELALALKDLHRMPAEEGGAEYTTLHGDLKPANIVCMSGQYKLIDFAYSVGKNSSIGVDQLPTQRGKTRTFGM